MNNFFERRYIIAGIFITVILILLARLYYIQIVDDRYLTIANGNVIKRFVQFPARGVIVDRNDKILVTNELVYEVSVIPKDVKPFDTLEFCRLIDITKEDFDERLRKARTHSPNLSSAFEKQLSPKLYASLQERMSEFSGFTVQPHPIRAYPDSIAAQFLGYIGEVNEEKLKVVGDYYHAGDYIGITGVEKQYEEVLRGQRGVKNMLVNSRGVPQGAFENGARDTVPIPGERLTSSLDIRLQKLGETLMQNKVGSIVAIEPSTGEILCFVSSPTYNPNLMSGKARTKNFGTLYKNPYNPFSIRPTQARYMPGSSFKPLSALIALQEGIITPANTYNCPGVYRSITGGRTMKCTHIHGVVNLSGAIAGSCNGYFSWVFEKIMNARGGKATEASYRDWRDKVKKLGIGVKLGVDLPDEKSGILASADFYNDRYRRGGWRSSTILSLAIGQGEVEATPLQLANIEATIANRGFFYKPHLIKAIAGKQVIKEEYLEKNYVGVDGQYFEQVINGMQRVVDDGTAAGSKIPGIVMCGKTGTVQNSYRNGKDHSVFVAFAPRDNPKIAIAVIVENSGDGGTYAAPIASFIVEKYLKDSISKRPSGIYPEYYIEKNLLPELKAPAPKTNVPADSAKKEVVKVSRKPNNKTANAPTRKTNPGVKLTAILTKLIDDEYPAA
jgi:penicillin-binding protein 2